MIHSVKIKKRSIELLFVISIFCSWQTSAQTFPSYTIETYEESARLKKDNPSLQMENDTLPQNFMIVLTFADSIQSYLDSVPKVSKIHIKVGSASGRSDFFQGTFTVNDVANIPARSYYGINGKKHYIKVYLEGITKESAKNLSVQLENRQGTRSASTTGTITE